VKLKNSKRAVRQTSDHENPEWTREEFACALTSDELPSRLRQKISTCKRGPQKTPTKVPVSIRLSPEVLAAFRASGAGWQARVDDILREHIEAKA
jgi:uncharacterized protein (DUF4415 family)